MRVDHAVPADNIKQPSSIPKTAFAARGATKAIPIVFVTGTNPVEVELVAGLNRSGGNLTGVTLLLSEVMAKRVEQLHELVPAALHVSANGMAARAQRYCSSREGAFV